MSSETAAPPPEPWAPVQVPVPGPRGLRFSRTEVRHLSLALGALVAAFTILYLTPVSGGAPSDPLPLILLTTAIVGPAFVLHELAHKVVAQRKGCWAEFRAWPFGLLMMLVMSVTGFLFAAPGAVMIAGQVGVRDFGRIGAAGPLTNVLFVAGAIPFFLTPFRGPAALVVQINAMLAVLNMLPLAPLDGEKVLRASKRLYAMVVVSIGAVIGLAVAAWTWGQGPG